MKIQMKRINSILAISLLIMAGCGGNKQSDDLITVDVTKSYPKKELILQDFMDVEYIPLETSREFLCQGIVQAIGKDIILVRNSVRDGDIFIFDRAGKGLRKVNRMGQGPEEYINISSITLDEDNNEMFVNDIFTNKIFVYDLYGKFKRYFGHKEGAMYNTIYNFDKDNLICKDGSSNREQNGGQSFAIISKQDGSIVKDIEIQFDQVISNRLRVTNAATKMIYTATFSYSSIIPHCGNWILTELSSDTVFMYFPDHKMTPFIVRTPSIQSMTTEVLLSPGILSEHYYFMESVKKEFDFETKQGFPSTDLMYDRQEKAIFEYVVYNNDYSNKRSVNMAQETVNDEIAFWRKIDADQLVEDYEKGQLKGKLKEIASNLKEEDNPVIMLAKYKK